MLQKPATQFFDGDVPDRSLTDGFQQNEFDASPFPFFVFAQGFENGPGIKIDSGGQVQAAQQVFDALDGPVAEQSFLLG